jgi:hypothetical protein
MITQIPKIGGTWSTPKSVVAVKRNKL